MGSTPERPRDGVAGGSDGDGNGGEGVYGFVGGIPVVAERAWRPINSSNACLVLGGGERATGIGMVLVVIMVSSIGSVLWSRFENDARARRLRYRVCQHLLPTRHTSQTDRNQRTQRPNPGTGQLTTTLPRCSSVRHRQIPDLLPLV